MKLKLISNIY